MRALGVAAGVALLGAGHAALNARLLRRCSLSPPLITDRVAVLVPARDEAAVIGPCLDALRVQRQLADFTVTVLDDGSTDATAAIVGALARTDRRVSLVTGAPLPAGWLGKPYACAQLAAACPDAGWLVYVDADVVLAPTAVASAVAAAMEYAVDLLCPFPRQLADGPAERLLQPLLAWSWLTFVPLRWAERSQRPSLAVATGQFLVVRRAAYDRAGTHGAVRAAVLEDLALARAVRRTGGRTTVADGRDLAQCRMYCGWSQLREGYSKSLWSAFGSPLRALLVLAALGAAYVLPAVAALAGSRLALAGYLAGVAGRAVAARRSGSRAWPDSLWHPGSVVLVGWLAIRSLWQRRHATLTWKGRAV